MNLFDAVGQVFTDTDNLWGEITGQNRAKENLQYQRENLEYQKALQEKIFQREDTAYQRTRDDMLSAGLNPLSMSGTNGAGQPVQTEAPQQNVEAFNNLSQAISFGNELTNLLNGISDRRAKEVTSAKEEAETKSLNADADRKNLENQYLEEQLLLRNEYDAIRNKDAARILDWRKKYGIYPESGSIKKTATDIQQLLDENQLDAMIKSAEQSDNPQIAQLGKLLSTALSAPVDKISPDTTNVTGYPSLIFPFFGNSEKKDVKEAFPDFETMHAEMEEKKKQKKLAKEKKKLAKQNEKSAKKISNSRARYWNDVIRQNYINAN